MSVEAAVAVPPSAARPGLAAPGVRRRAVFAWCLYDWANSPYITIVTTFVFSTYFVKSIASSEAVGQAQWGWAMGLAAVVIALTSPVLGAIADRAGRRKPWLLAFTLIIALGATALWWAKPGPGGPILVLFVAALTVTAFEISMAFYNAMLPGLVKPAYIGRVSGWGWGLGYLGGLACLALALFVFIEADPPPLGLDKSQFEHVRIAGPIVAAWTVLFALPLFLFVPDVVTERMPIRPAVRLGIKELGRTLREIRRYREIFRFLVARILFMEGINTLFIFGGIYAGSVFGMSVGEVAMFGIALNVTAAAGAFAFGWMDDKIGSKPTILLGVFAIAALGVPLLLITSTTTFWVLGCLIGLFFGPVQSAARSMMARMAPPGKETEMFGLLALSGKVIAFLGPLAVALVTELTSSQRWGMSVVLPFIVVGGLVLLTVKPPPQRAA